MQDLLTRGIDEHGNLRSEQTHEFKDSPLGRIPVEWDMRLLGLPCGVSGSGHTPNKQRPAYWNGGIRRGVTFRIPVSSDDLYIARYTIRSASWTIKNLCSRASSGGHGASVTAVQECDLLSATARSRHHWPSFQRVSWQGVCAIAPRNVRQMCRHLYWLVPSAGREAQSSTGSMNPAAIVTIGLNSSAPCARSLLPRPEMLMSKSRIDKAAIDSCDPPLTSTLYSAKSPQAQSAASCRTCSRATAA